MKLTKKYPLRRQPLLDNLLIIKFGALGDVVRTSFILPGLNMKYKNASLYWFTSNSAFDLLRFNPFIAGLFTPTLNLKILENIPFDRIISLDDEIDVLRLIKNLKFKDILGAYLDNNGVPAYTDSASIWFDLGLISRYGKQRADQLKQENRFSHREIMEKMLDIKIERPIFFNSSIIEKSKKTLFSPDFFNIGLNSGAGRRWPSKELKIEETIKLVDKLLFMRIHGKPVKVFLLGGETEMDRHNKIMEAVNNPNLIDSGNNNSILEFAAIIKSLDYVISGDSFALHVAIAQEKPNLSFYSPSPPWEIDTFGIGVKVVSTSADFCSFKKGADNSTITAERLYSSLIAHINNHKKLDVAFHARTHTHTKHKQYFYPSKIQAR